MKITIDAYKTPNQPTWCPGCGNFGIWAALKGACLKLNIGPDDGFLVYGIGCHGNMNNIMAMYGSTGLHGRGIPLAQGVKLANHKLPVIVITGDGDCIGEGGNHFIHAAKRNADITVIIHDNQVYALTTGQASPTARVGLKTKSTPHGVVETPMNPLILALSAGATFVSRGFSGDIPLLTDLIVQAVLHKGFSVVDVLQPCVTFNKPYGYEWYRERVYSLEKEGYKGDNKLEAIEKANMLDDRIAIGVLYREKRQTSEESEPALKNNPLISLPLDLSDMDDLVKEFV